MDNLFTPDFECMCFSKNVETEYRRERMEIIGTDERPEIVIPVRYCRDCGFEWEDSEGESVRQDALDKVVQKMKQKAENADQ